MKQMVLLTKGYSKMRSEICFYEFRISGLILSMPKYQKYFILFRKAFVF